MPRPRKQLVCAKTTPYYHVTARCVRRAFLCGHDVTTGQSYEHRREWIENRLGKLASLFSIEVCAYAIMSNHYHLVVRIRPEVTEDWGNHKVLKRWCALFKGPLLVQEYLKGKTLSGPEIRSVRSCAAVYRKRLGDLSWFMKCLNEPIARQANAEDECTGHFWESRFHSQALLSQRALVAAMAYVDLNPIRAGMATTPETSEFTSIRARLEAVTGTCQHKRDVPLASCSATVSLNNKTYIQLVEASGRLAARGKPGRIDTKLPPILIRLGLSMAQWTAASLDFQAVYSRGELAFKKSA
ncbi:MAG: hypothetical protein AAF385_03050 [Pseudomonadota bacterium]